MYLCDSAVSYKYCINVTVLTLEVKLFHYFQNIESKKCVTSVSYIAKRQSSKALLLNFIICNYYFILLLSCLLSD